MGTETLGELYSQRQQLENVDEQIHVIDDRMAQSKRILRCTRTRANTHLTDEGCVFAVAWPAALPRPRSCCPS